MLNKSSKDLSLVVPTKEREKKRFPVFCDFSSGPAEGRHIDRTTTNKLINCLKTVRPVSSLSLFIHFTISANRAISDDDDDDDYDDGDY